MQVLKLASGNGKRVTSACTNQTCADRPTSSVRCTAARTRENREVDSCHSTVEPPGKVACWAAQTGTQIEDTAAFANCRPLGKRVHCLDSTVVVLIELEQIRRTQLVRAFSLLLECIQNLPLIDR